MEETLTAVPATPGAATSVDELRDALGSASKACLPLLGQTLIEMGCVTEADLASALAAQRRGPGLRIGEQLLSQGRISHHQLDAALNQRLGFARVDVRALEPQMAALHRVPLAVCRRLNALPLLLEQGQLVVALSDPKRQSDIDELAWVSECWVTPTVGHAADIALRLDQWASQWSPTLPPEARGEPSAADAAAPKLHRRQTPLLSPAPATGFGPMEPVSAPDAAVPLPNGAPAAPALATAHFPSQPAAPLHSSLRWLAELERQAPLGGEEEPAQWAEENDNALVKLINGVIIEAHEAGASDIHVECRPGKEKVLIRMRRDGHLRDHLELPHPWRSALVARLKIMCGLDVSERRRPQDGRIHFTRSAPDAPIELRMVTVPTQHGLEDVVLRLLSSMAPLGLRQLGLHPRTLEQFTQAVERPHGLILCAGPTGSGKTTTLHSALAHLNTRDRKIWTAEDPVEITQTGLRQVQINPRLNWTFDKALRTFLRADPDVIMVGEIRDRETARTAVEAALTGHLVLSTIHTNSATETLTRLLDMGLDPFNFGDSLLAVMSQRLVRRWCPSCVSSRVATDEEVDDWLSEHLKAEGIEAPERNRMADALLIDWMDRFGLHGRFQVHHAAGCTACEGTGYLGRIGVHELLVVTPQVRRMIHCREPLEKVLATAVGQGMLTLRQDGIEKVLQGLTSMNEIRATINA